MATPAQIGFVLKLDRSIEMGPWFYGCLSWTILGAGQFYSGRISKGLLFLFLAICADNVKDYMLGTTRFLGLLPAAMFFIFGMRRERKDGSRMGRRSSILISTRI